jgi:hypothetical protein
MAYRPSTIAWLVALLGPVACTIPADAASIQADVPSETAAEWVPVADYLGHRCGSLDCHGDSQRNFVIYGCNGLRLDPSAIPGCVPGPGTTPTSADEYALTYRSLVGLEPEIMSQVVDSSDPNIDLLTFVRKARGEESHKGGTLITPGDAQDRCIYEWLAGENDTSDCALALESTP